MNDPFRRRRSNRDRTLPSWIATAANTFGPEYELLVCRAICLTARAWFSTTGGHRGSSRQHD